MPADYNTGGSVGDKNEEVSRPSILDVRPDMIPGELKDISAWVNWKLSRTNGSNPNWTKPPIQPSGTLAKVNDPMTWHSYPEVWAAYEEGGFDGIGFVLTLNNLYVGGDLDKCRNPATEEVDHWAAEIIDGLNSYTEISPCGTGFRIIFKANLPPGGRKKGRFEVYDSHRYVTLTGHHLEGTPMTIEERQDAINRIHIQFFGSRPLAHRQATEPFSEDDAANVIGRAKTATNGKRFSRLWEGDTSSYSSQSEADLALCGFLAYWAGNNPTAVDILFRQSGLYRDKWDEPHFADGRTYGQATIDKAIQTGRGRAASDDADTGNAGGVNAGGGNGTENGPGQRGYNLTDYGNAQRLVQRHGRDLRYCHPWKKWLVWNGQRWNPDDTGEFVRRAKETILSYYSLASNLSAQSASTAEGEERKRKADLAEALLKWAKRSEAVERLQAMVKLASSEPEIPILPGDLDKEIYLLNCLNGTIDLRTGKLRPHRREDFITKLAPVDYKPEAKCPKWIAFLKRIMGNSNALVSYLRRACGYSLTGNVSEDVIFILYGTGRNGKSTFLETLLEISGDYGFKAPPTLLMAKRGEVHPTEKTILFGVRFTPAIETAEGRRFDEAIVKELTGGDRVTARRMREDYWTFKPTHHLWVATNHKPVVRGSDLGFWSRVRLIPFIVTIPKEERDMRLKDKLREESPGILAWVVKGGLEWAKDGLQDPPEVLAATREYRDQMDVLGDFLAEKCIQDDEVRVKVGRLYEVYQAWNKDCGERPVSKVILGQMLEDRDFKRVKGTKGVRMWEGISLLEEEE